MLHRSIAAALMVLPWLLAGPGCAGSSGQAIARNPAVLSHALENRREFRAELVRSCDALPEVQRIIGQAIAIGAPIYNARSPLGCYRIYEGASYKALYSLGDRCPQLTAVLRAGLAQAEADASVSDKAWTLRRTFDAILGADTVSDPRQDHSL